MSSVLAEMGPVDGGIEGHLNWSTHAATATLHSPPTPLFHMCGMSWFLLMSLSLSKVLSAEYWSDSYPELFQITDKLNRSGLFIYVRQKTTSLHSAIRLCWYEKALFHVMILSDH